MQQFSSDFHETLQDYELLLWEETTKFWGLILLKMAR